MTCIAICKDKNNRLMIAGDRRSSWGWHKAQSMPKPKISSRSNVLLGATGDGFLCSLLVDVMKIPKRGTKDLDQYMFNDFYNAVYIELIKHGLGEEHNLLKIPEEMGCELIVGIENRVFTINIENREKDKISPEGIIAIDEVNTPYATGCGDSADAVLRYILKTKKYIAEKDLKTAIEVIADIAPGCDNNIDLIVAT